MTKLTDIERAGFEEEYKEKKCCPNCIAYNHSNVWYCGKFGKCLCHNKGNNDPRQEEKTTTEEVITDGEIRHAVSLLRKGELTHEFKKWLAQHDENLLSSERRETGAFLENVLNGIDIADEQMGNKGGGTKAIRLALISRGLLTDKEELKDK